MATIGTFKKSGSEFVGEIVTLSVQAKGVRIVPGRRHDQRQRAQPPRLRRPRRDRRRLVEALQRGPRLPQPQARRSELHPADLRQPFRRHPHRGRGELQPHLVAGPPPERRLIRAKRPARTHRAGPPPCHSVLGLILEKRRRRDAERQRRMPERDDRDVARQRSMALTGPEQWQAGIDAQSHADRHGSVTPQGQGLPCFAYQLWQNFAKWRSGCLGSISFSPSHSRRSLASRSSVCEN